MKIRELRMDFAQGVTVQVWSVCETKEDCDEMIAWLQLAKANMKQWEKIHAKASRTAKTPLRQNEVAKSREVLSSPSVEVGADGFDPRKATYPIGQ